MRKGLASYSPISLVVVVAMLLGAVACNTSPTPAPRNQVTPQPGVKGLAALGLRGEYYQSPNFSGPRTVLTDGQINFNWGKGAAVRGQRPGTLSVRWKGQIAAQRSGTYTLSLTSAGGSGRLTVDGQATNTVKLLAGVPVDIQVEFQQSAEDPALKLEWESADAEVKREIVPVGRLGLSQAALAAQNVTTGTVSRGQNLLTNGDFESGTGAWTYGFAVTPGVAGNAALLGAGAYLQQNLPREAVEVGAPYTLSASVKSTAGNPSACTVGLATFDPEGSVTRQVLSFGSSAAGVWTQATLPFSPQPNQTLLSVYLQSGAAECAFDNLTLQVTGSGVQAPVTINWLNDSDFEQPSALSTWNTAGRLAQPGAQNSANALSMTNSSWSQQDLSASVIQSLQANQGFTLTADGKALNGGGCLVGFRGGNSSDVLFTKWLDFRNSDWTTASVAGTVPAGMTWGAVFLADGLQECQYDNVKVGSTGVSGGGSGGGGSGGSGGSGGGSGGGTGGTGGTDPVTDPIPPDMTYGSPIALEFPMFTSDDTAYFDVYRLGDDAYSGKNFRWNFGDGATSTGDSVKHDYKTPGTYTVTLNYENAKGVAKEFKTQVASISVAKLVDKAANNENLTAKFDAGEEIPGLTYEYTVEDKGGQTATMSGSKASHTYAGVGTFDYTLTVRDSRAQMFGTQSLTSGRIQAQALEPNRVIFKRTAWNVFWQRAPIADITWTGSDLAGAPLSTIRPGSASTTVQFNAGTTRENPRNFSSFDSELKYEWSFGDGTTSTERNPAKTYTLTKPFLVTLTVTNKYGLKDTKKLFYHIRDFQYDTTLRTEYPGGTTTRTSVDPPPISAQSVFVSSGSPTDADSEAYLPWVLPYRNNVKLGVHYPIKTTGERTFSLCNEYKLFVNGGERYPQYVEQGGTVPDVTILDPFLPPVTAQFCDAMVMGPGNIAGLQRSSWNVIEILSSRGSNRISVNSFHHLNVPRVMVSVLPDELIPGEQASPVVTQWHAFNDDTKVEELVVNVKIRQSELPSGNIKFKVPVYAVDITGKRQKTVDGAMYARFNDYTDDNDPVTFVDGVAEMPVSLNGSLFGPDAQQIDLTNIQYASSNGDCGLGDGPLARAAKSTVKGCTTDKAVYAYPTANAPVSVPQLPEFYQKSRPFFGHVLYGKTSKEAADDIRTILDQHKRNTLEGIDFIVPILWNEHRKEYLDLINRGNAKGFFTLGERLQLAAMGIGLVGDAIPVVHTGLKLAGKVIDGVQIWIKGVSPGSKAVIKAADEALSPAATAGKLPEEAATLIPPKLGVSTNKLLNDCNSQICFDAFDDLMDTIKASGRTEVEARALADQAIKEVDDWTTVNGYTHLPNEKLHNAELLTACKLLPNSFAPDTLVQTMSGLQRIDQIKVGVLVAGFDEQTWSEGYYPVTALHQNYDSETTVLALATEGGQQEQVTTTPNHPFYTTTGKWVEAGKLTAGDQLQRTGKAVGRVVNVTTTARTAQMFNLTVEQAHTFFVGVNGWLVHNTAGKCDPLSSLRNEGGFIDVVQKASIVEIKAGAVAEAKIIPPGAPYSVERVAEIVAEQYRRRIKAGLGRPSSSGRTYGLTVDVRQGKEVNSVSNADTTDLKLPESVEKANKEAKNIGSERYPNNTTDRVIGGCAEPRGCALLLKDDNARSFNPQDFITYAFSVDFKNGKIIVVPKVRCKEVCANVNYLSSPTDKLDGAVQYTFDLVVP